MELRKYLKLVTSYSGSSTFTEPSFGPGFQSHEGLLDVELEGLTTVYAGFLMLA